MTVLSHVSWVNLYLKSVKFLFLLSVASMKDKRRKNTSDSTYGVQTGWTYELLRMTPSLASLSMFGVFIVGLWNPTSFQPD